MGHIINIGLKTQTHIDRTEAYMMYEREARKRPLLSAEEEAELMERYCNSTSSSEKTQIRNKIIEHNQRFIIAAAKQYANQDIELFLNLVNEANIGFIEAFESYDITKTQGKGRILSWAVFYIRRAINRYLIDNVHMIKQSNKFVLYHKLAKAKATLAQRLSREASDEEIIEYLRKEQGIEINDVRDVARMTISSVDAFSDDEDTFNPTLAEFNSATGVTNSVENLTEHDYTHTLVKRAISVLNDKERAICEMLYGLNDNGIEYSMDVVAEHFGYSRERIRQIQQKCLKKMAITLKRAVATY